MSRQRFDLARAQFVQALARLEEALAENETDIVRDAIIQRFEFTFELGWKAMFYSLVSQGERVPEVVREVLQAAFRGHLIDDAATWERVRDNRNATSHTYNRDKAIEVAAFVRSDAVAAFKRLAAKLGAL